MRILYFSLHAILEHDEIRLLTGLGHTVFPLGDHFEDPPAAPFRPAVPLGPEIAALRARFLEEGCRFSPWDRHGSVRLTPGFVAEFDASIVMHSAQFVDENWPALHVRPCILRAIGVNIAGTGPTFARLRAGGVTLVRYAESEALVPGFGGQDAVIRFGKDPADFLPWTGEEAKVLSFVNGFAARWPEDHALHRRAVAGLPSELGGRENEGEPDWIGLVPHEVQKERLRRCRAYLYCSGRDVPYTLNFMEAWMAGIPVVVVTEGLPAHAEIPRLVRDGVDAILAPSATAARDALSRLLADHALAARIGAAGRESATRIFGNAAIAPQWQALLDRLAAR